MKLFRSMAIALVILSTVVIQAHAGAFGTAGTLKPGHVAFGIEPTLAFLASDFGLFLHGGFGLARSIDLDLKLGLGSNVSFGADVEFNLIPDSRHSVGISLAVGGHGSSNFALDTTLLLSNRFKTFTLYLALDTDIYSTENADGDTIMMIPVWIDLGIAIPVARKMEFLLEGNIGFTDSAISGISGGWIFYF